MLIIGEAIIEGIGASLMMPATLARSFDAPSTATSGPRPSRAWGATAGAAVAFGPVLGGFLTTNYSWRWAFGINVIVAPIAIIGALAVHAAASATGGDGPIDVPGAAPDRRRGMFLLVFALSDGGSVRVVAHRSRTSRWPVPSLAVVGAGLDRAGRDPRRRCCCSSGSSAWSGARNGAGAEPLFEFSLLQCARFRYGLLTTQILAMGQLALLSSCPCSSRTAPTSRRSATDCGCCRSGCS